MTLSPLAATLLAVWLTTTPTDDVEAIRAVLTDYTEGVKSGDGARPQRAFHPTANLLHVGPDGGFAIWPGSDFIQPRPQADAGQVQPLTGPTRARLG